LIVDSRASKSGGFIRVGTVEGAMLRNKAAGDIALNNPLRDRVGFFLGLSQKWPLGFWPHSGGNHTSLEDWEAWVNDVGNFGAAANWDDPTNGGHQIVRVADQAIVFGTSFMGDYRCRLPRQLLHELQSDDSDRTQEVG
jgi:hypothetical protein